MCFGGSGGMSFARQIQLRLALFGIKQGPQRNLPVRQSEQAALYRAQRH